MNPRISLFLVLGLALCAAIGFGFMSFISTPTRGSLTTDTKSSAFPDDASKIAFLSKYLKLLSPIDTAEFYIVYQDNSSGVPGPDDYDLKVAMKIPKEHLPLWTTGLQPDPSPVDLTWITGLLPKDDRWAISSTATVYRRGGTILVVHVAEGIVLKRVQSNP